MNKVEMKWNFKIEKKLFNFFRKISNSILNKKEKFIDYEELTKIFINYSVSFEREYKKVNKIDLKKHNELAKKQIEEIKKWQNKLTDYIKANEKQENIKEKLRNNAKFRARNMLGNYYKDFLKEIVSQESEYFEWNTMGDERVRPEHEEKHGKIYNWDTAEIFPGEEAGCRCWATVYFPTKQEKEEIEFQ